MNADVSEFGLRLKREFALGPFDVESYKGERGRSVTVQGDSFSIAELFQRAQSGLVVPSSAPQFATEDASFDDLDREQFMQLDLFDRQEIVQKYGAEVRRRLDEAKAAEAARKAAQEEAASGDGGVGSSGVLVKEESEKPSVSQKSSRFEKSKSSKKLEGRSSPPEEE